MNELVKNYINSKKKLLQYFKCPVDYHIHDKTDCNWTISDTEDVAFLSCWKPKHTNKDTFVVVNKDSAPMVYRAEAFTLVIAIDCVKTGVLLDNRLEIPE